ncbi:glycosyltransferase [Nocardioides plantarum]|nr:glycosyltransferase [Nocardioides plantarum]
MTPPFGSTVPGNRWDLAEALTPEPDLRVSVVVSHYEQPRELARTLAALAHQTRVPDEIVVTDDGSAVAPTVPDGVRLVRQEDHGFRVAAARNHGVEATTGDLLVLLDADTAPEPDCVAALVDLPSRLPECLVVGRRRYASYDEGGGSRRELPEPAWLADAYVASRDLLDADETSHRFVIGAVLACSRWWWDEVAGFDESFSSYGGEDWDLAHRSWVRGGLLAHRPDAVAWHDGPDAGPRGDAGSLVESVAVADRVAAPGTGWRGLLRGPADVVVACAPVMTPTELLVTVDSLWSSVPTARVQLSAEHRRLVGEDPRLVDVVGDDVRLLLDLRHGAMGDWVSALRGLDGPDGYAARDVGVGTLTDLRLRRRAERWGRAALAPLHPEVDRSLTPWAPRHTLEAWVGGWAR